MLKAASVDKIDKKRKNIICLSINLHEMTITLGALLQEALIFEPWNVYIFYIFTTPSKSE